jgi:uncharacterized hydantoinase/oxoprolinase family protein
MHDKPKGRVAVACSAVLDDPYMTKEQLQKIKERVESAKACADRIMDGGDNYDGADGAREVRDLCATANELITELEKTVK